MIPIASDGGNPTADTCYALEESIGNANFAMNGVLTTPAIRRRLRKTPMIVGGYDSIWTDEDTICAQPARTSTNVPSTLAKGSGVNLHMVAAADWSQLAVGTFGDLEIIADRVTAARTGQIVVTIFSYTDVVAIRPSAFALCTDAEP